MKIISITRNHHNVPEGFGVVFSTTAGEGGTMIVSANQILYCRDGYANGPGKKPVYVVKQEGSPIVIQIPESEIVEVVVDIGETKGKKKAATEPAIAEAAVELPE